MRNIRMVLEYDGTDFHGFQKQRRCGLKTVQDELEKVLCRILQDEVKTNTAGRTDAGVHAVGQVVNFKTSSSLKISDMKRALNALLPETIAIKELVEAREDFHARFSAKSRFYNYYILNRETPSALLRLFSYHVKRPLDLDRMRRASEYLTGEKDFTSFSCDLREVENPLRKLEYIRILKGDMTFQDSRLLISDSGILKDLVVIEFKGNGFLRSMVRFIVAALIKVGDGRLSPEDLGRILDEKRPGLVFTTVPACGLFLTKVEY